MTPVLSGHFVMADPSQQLFRREIRTERKQYKFRPSIAKILEGFASRAGLSETDIVERAAEQAAKSLPLLAEMYCGSIEVLPEDFVQRWVNVGDLLTVKEGDFLVPAHGTSMIGDGVKEGDLIQLRPQNFCDSGDVVAISMKTATGDRITLRRIEAVDNAKTIRLLPINESQEVIEIKAEELPQRLCAVKRGFVRQR